VIANRLSAATGADVRIGWISWNPAWPGGPASARRGPNAKAPAVVTAQTLDVDVALCGGSTGTRVSTRSCCAAWIALRRTGPGDFNLALLPGLTADEPEPPPASASDADMGPPPPFRIGLLRIVSGSIEFRDETITPALETSLHLDDASAHDLVLANDGSAGLAFHVESRLEDEPLTLDVTYDTGAESSRLTAKLVAAHASLARALLYVPLGWQRTSGTMDATVTYERRLEKGTLRKHGLTADLALHDLALTEPWASAHAARETVRVRRWRSTS
jgi:hypothetical protein